MMKILYIHDDDSAISLIKAALSLSPEKYEILHRDDLINAATEIYAGVDVVLCDLRMINFSGITMLELVKDIDPDLPFIFLSDHLGEENALELYRLGASEVISKSNIHLLSYIIHRADREYRSKNERKQLNFELTLRNQLLNTVLNNLNKQVIYTNNEGKINFANQSFFDFVGKGQQEVLGERLADVLHKINNSKYKLTMSQVKSLDKFIILVRTNTENRYMEVSRMPVMVNQEKVGLITILKDVSDRIRLENELEQDRYMLLQAEELTRSGSFTYDPGNNRLKLSSNLRRMLDLEQHEEIFLKKLIHMVHPGDRKLFWRALRILKKNQEVFEMDHRYMPGRSMAQMRYCKTVIKKHQTSTGSIFYGTTQDTTEGRKASLALLNLMENDMEYISRELHDSVGQKLSAASIFLGGKDAPDHRVKLLIDESISEIRQISRRLSGSVVVHRKLSEALEILLANIPIGEIVHLSNQCEDELLTDFVAGQIYRIIQESLNNCMKYSKANKVVLELHVKEGFLTLNIMDDGVGFDQREVIQGNGLRNIKERVRSCNGIVRIASAYGYGTRIFINIPLTDA